jgi:hypothetical protein
LEDRSKKRDRRIISKPADQKESFALIAGINIIPIRTKARFRHPAYFDWQTFEWQLVKSEGPELI